MENFKIDKFKYNELKYFCRQYPEWKRKGIECEKREMIEKSAIEADPETHSLLIENVTEGIPYEYMAVPRGRRQFYNKRRKFFYILSKKR